MTIYGKIGYRSRGKETILHVTSATYINLLQYMQCVINAPVTQFLTPMTHILTPRKVHVR